jgi:small subunit ribosomal protein S6
MPKYELMYIVSSTISDDQIPTVTDGVLKYIVDFGGTVIKEELMGKKKLAYPIKKTRNGFYAGVTFELPGAKVNELDTKVKTTPGIIRHLIIGIDEALERMAKDAIAQEAMNKNRNERAKTAAPAEGSSEAPVTDENIDQKIEEALTEDLKNV